MAQRTRELGIRIALGARSRQVVGLVVREGMLLAAGGMLIGIALSVVLSRLLDKLLFQVRPSDSTVVATAAVVLAVVALVAAYLPARRATRIDPVVALREY